MSFHYHLHLHNFSGNWFSYTFGENSTGHAFSTNENVDPMSTWADKK